MSTTTVGDLLTRAHWLSLELQQRPGPVSHDSWLAFGQANHRLLHLVLGPPREATDAGHAQYAQLRRLLQQCAPPVKTCRARSCHATRDQSPHLPDAASDLPIERITITLGALADLLQAARVADAANGQRPSALDPALDQSQLGPVLAQVLTVAITTGRVADQHLPLQHKPRPQETVDRLQNALQGLQRLGVHPEHSRLLDLPSRSARPHGHGLNPRLEQALHTWNHAARDELRATIPSTDVLRNIANQGIHLYALTHALTRTLGDDHPLASQATGLRDQLRHTAGELQRLDQLWGSVTTAARPSKDYVQAATDLFKILNHALPPASGTQQAPTPATDLDTHQALRALSYAAGDLADLLQQARPLPDTLARSGLLYAPARTLPGDLRRLRANLLGHLAPMTPPEATQLRHQTDLSADATTRLHQRLSDLQPQLQPARHPVLADPALPTHAPTLPSLT